MVDLKGLNVRAGRGCGSRVREKILSCKGVFIEADGETPLIGAT